MYPFFGKFIAVSWKKFENRPTFDTVTKARLLSCLQHSAYLPFYGSNMWSVKQLSVCEILYYINNVAIH